MQLHANFQKFLAEDFDKTWLRSQAEGRAYAVQINGAGYHIAPCPELMDGYGVVLIPTQNDRVLARGELVKVFRGLWGRASGN